MGLSEFISKNQERPDPKIEWESSKLFLKTIDKSGAVKLLEQLRDSILSNPVFDHGVVNVKRRLFVYNKSKIQEIMMSELSLAGISPTYRDIDIELPNRHEGKYASLDSIPTARVEFNYNGDYNVYGGDIFNGQVRSYAVNDTLGIDCNKVGRLRVWLEIRRQIFYGSRPTPIFMEEEQWRSPGSLDNILGQLFSQNPPIKLVE